MSVFIRDLAWPDLPRVEDVERRLFPQDAWPSATWWAELAERPRRDYVVAVDDSRVLGYAGADHGGATTDIMTIAVDPGDQGRGVGRLLLQELESRATGRGAEAILLEVRADNAAAIRLYDRGGYAVIQTRRRYYQPGDVDALVMRRFLARATSEAAG